VDGYDSFFSFSQTKKGWSGVATYARKGLTVEAEEGFGDDKFNDEASPVPSRVICAAHSTLLHPGRCVMTDHGKFILFNVYFPNGRDGERVEYKQSFHDTFRRRCNDLAKSGRHCIVTGDVNIAHEDADIWNPAVSPEKFAASTGFLPSERQWITDLLNDGWVDAFRKFHPTREKAFTFWDMRTMKRPINQGWRIDYFLVPKSLMDVVQDSDILPQVLGSDHCPLTLDL
ncbi:Endonuclease/exonuclease/phosphatase, partial [Blyttiomyces helicus]